MSLGCSDLVWDYVRPSSSFQNAGSYAPPSTPRVHAFPAVPRTEAVDWKMQVPVGGIGKDVCSGRHNPYRRGFTSFDLRFTYLKEGGHQVSRSPGPGNYETRHLTGGALVRRPKTASPCFRRPGGRLDFGGGGTWHAETPLECAEWRGTVRGNLKRQPQHYSMSFRSRADRLVVNKPSSTTHEGVGPGCYDLSKDGKSIGVRTEKRVGRGRNGGMGSTNQFLVDWRAYLKRPPGVKDNCGGGVGRDGRRGGGCSGCRGGSGNGGGVGGGVHRHLHAEHGSPEPAPPPAFQRQPETPKLVPYTLPGQSDSWPAARIRSPRAGAGRRDMGEGEGGRLPGTGARSAQKEAPRQLVHREQEEHDFFPKRQQQQQQQQQQQDSGGHLHGRTKRPASAAPSLRADSKVETFGLSRRCHSLPRRPLSSNVNSGSGGPVDGDGTLSSSAAALSTSCSRTAVSTASTDASGRPHFAPKPPSVEVVARPITPRAEAVRGVSNFVDILGRSRSRSGSAQAAARPVEDR